MRVLIVGSSGYVGSALSTFLIKRKHEVLGTSTKGFPYLQLNIENFVDCMEFFSRENFDVVINLSGRGVTSGSANINEMLEVNFKGARNLSEALVNSPNTATRVLHVSSSTEPASGAKAESEYSMSKALGTRAVREILGKAGIEYATVALHNTYGRGQPSGRLIAAMIASLRAGDPFLLKYPERVRDFCFIEDVVANLTMLIESRLVANKFEMGTARGVSLINAAKMSCDFLKVSRSLLEVASVPIEDPHNYSVADAKKSGFLKCGTSLEHGIQMVIEENA